MGLGAINLNLPLISENDAKILGSTLTFVFFLNFFCAYTCDEYFLVGLQLIACDFAFDNVKFDNGCSVDDCITFIIRVASPKNNLSVILVLMQ